MMPMERWRYPEDWERIAREVKDEAGWRCEQCRAARHEYHVSHYEGRGAA